MLTDHNMPPQSKETRVWFWRGFETAIEACVLIIQHRQQKTGREIVSAMRDLMIEQVPKSED